MKTRPTDPHAVRVPQRSGLPECLYIPIAARNSQAIEKYVGKIISSLSIRSPKNAFVVASYPPAELDLRLPIWAVRESTVLHSPEQIWVHVNYSNYRNACKKMFPGLQKNTVIDHVMNRREARVKGFDYIRVLPVDRAVNSSHGGLSERWGVDYHSTEKMKVVNKASEASVQYADLADIVKMMNIGGGGSLMDNVNEAQKLIDLP